MVNEPKKIKVIVADDSALMRKLIPEMLKNDAEIEVVATAMDGLLALKKIEQYQPDVITLDIMMPNMDGMTALKHIASQFRIPVIIVSSLTQRGATITLEALDQGAVDFVTKPQKALPEHLVAMAEELIAKIKAVARYRPRRLQPSAVTTDTSELEQPDQKLARARRLEALDREARLLTQPAAKPLISSAIPPMLVCIGISTGGPEALSYLLPRLPGQLAAAVMIVQHMPEGFTAQFARRLDSRCELTVKEAEDGDLVIAGRVLLAPGGKHLSIKRMPLAITAAVSAGAPVCGHCPSADILFAAAAEFGNKTIGIIMTGMGEDGVAGLGQIKQAGGTTIAQDEASSVIFGMPKVALARGFASEALALEQIPDYLIQKVGLL